MEVSNESNPPPTSADASGAVHAHTLAEKTRELLYIIQNLPREASTLQTAIGELESEIVSETELQALVSADLSCFQRQIEGFQENYLAYVATMSRLSALFRSRLRQLVAVNDDAMNQSDSLHVMVNATVRPELWQCMLGLSSEMARVRSLLDQRRALSSRPLAVYLSDVVATTDATAAQRAHLAGNAFGGSPCSGTSERDVSALSTVEHSDVVFGLSAVQCTMTRCFHDMAEFWIHLMNCKDESKLMIVLDKSVKQLLTHVHTLLLHSPMTIQAFPTTTDATSYSGSEHHAFIEQHVNRHVDLWKYNGPRISAYIVEQIQTALVAFIPPNMQALRLKAIAPGQTAFDVHVAAKLAYDLSASGVRMLSSYNEQAYTHSVALVFIELLFAYASILEDVVVLHASVAQCATVGPNARACMLKIDQRFTAIHRKFTQMWTSQFRLGISICSGSQTGTPSKSMEDLCSAYTQALDKLEALTDVQTLDEALPQSVEYPFTSLLTRMAACLPYIRLG